MQQSVLIAACRGPDGIRKDHVSKLLNRWLRRCFMISSFVKVAIENPYDPGGGSFTGPSLGVQLTPDTWHEAMDTIVARYIKTLDELPHHFQLHFMHAAQILGYKHPNAYTRIWWIHTYHRIVHDMHLWPESEEGMDKRLGDKYDDWNARNDPSERASGPRFISG